MASKFGRRDFVVATLAGSSALVVAQWLPRPLSQFAKAQALNAVYPTIFIQLYGGVDVVMHFDARTGYVNRNVSAADISETNGIRWNETTLESMRTHMSAATLIRNVATSTGHVSGRALLWYGQPKEENAVKAVPWTNHLASQLLARGDAALPNLAWYNENPDDNVTNFVEYNNTSPNARAAAQRFKNINDLVATLPKGEVGNAAYQRRVSQHLQTINGRAYKPNVQPKLLEQFNQANMQADKLATVTIPANLWPPDTQTRTLFNLSDAQVRASSPDLKAQLAFAYQMTRYRLSHVITLSTPGTSPYDSHKDNVQRQLRASTTFFPEIARLLSALKTTQSPLEAGKSMLDTTHVVITSEMSRANAADEGTGTPHWAWSQVVLFGGKFKRGYAFAQLDNDLRGVPHNLDTGAPGGTLNPTWHHVVATILKANGVDSKGWTPALPINAVLT